MTIICHICDQENEETNPFCIKCGENLKDPRENKYEEPIARLREIGNELADKQMEYTQERIEESFNEIMDISQGLLDEAQRALEDNLLNLENLPLEQAELLGLDIDEAQSMKIFTDFISRFQGAQDDINDGLSMAKRALQDMRGFSELESETGQIDLETATDLLNRGLNKLEIITESAQEKMFPGDEIAEPPKQLLEAMSYLERIMTITSDYLEIPDIDSLKEMLLLLDDVKDCIQEIVTGAEAEKDEETDDVDEKLSFFKDMVSKAAYEENNQDKYLTMKTFEEMDDEDLDDEDEY